MDQWTWRVYNNAGICSLCRTIDIEWNLIMFIYVHQNIQKGVLSFTNDCKVKALEFVKCLAWQSACMTAADDDAYLRIEFFHKLGKVSGCDNADSC